MAIAVFVLGHANPSLAGPSCLKKPDHPNCTDPDDGDGESLKAKFDLTIKMGNYEHINADVTGKYHDSSKDHVQISGSGPGFRFDTNGQNTSKPSRFERARWVIMSFTGATPSKNFEIDFRFNQTNGLDLGLLEEHESGTVAASLQYYGGDPVTGFNADNYGILGFGALNAPNPNETCLTDAGKIKVTRNTETRWTLESVSDQACQFAKDANGNICTTERFADKICNVEPELIDFKFKFTIVQQ